MERRKKSNDCENHGKSVQLLDHGYPVVQRRMGRKKPASTTTGNTADPD
jgi:hypothetical protein